MNEILQYKYDIIIQNQTESEIEKFIQKFNKVSYIPNLIASIIIILFFHLIFIYPESLLEYFFSFFLVSIISLMIYYYDIHVISPKIKNREYEDVLFDALIWGILGCILYGIGILILIKAFLIIAHFINDIDANKVIEKKHEFISLLCRKLYNSLKSCSIKGGIVIIFLVFHKEGLNFFANLVTNLIDGEFIHFLSPFIIFLVISIIVLITELKLEENIEDQVFRNDLNITNRIVKSVLGCLFYFAGLFILFKTILVIIWNYYDKNIGKTSYEWEEKLEKIDSKKIIEEHEVGWAKFKETVANQNQIINSGGVIKKSEESIKTEFDSGQEFQVPSINKNKNNNLNNQEKVMYKIESVSFKSPKVKIPKIDLPKITIHIPKITIHIPKTTIHIPKIYGREKQESV